MKKYLFLLLAATALAQQVPSSYPYTVPLSTSGSLPDSTIKITGVLNPTGYGDNRPVVWDAFVGGGYRSVANATERNAILAGRRKEGMWVYTVDNGHLYQLASDLTTWTDLGTPATFGAASSGTAPIVTLNVASLKLLTSVPDGSILFTKGYYSAGDGGESVYRYDSSSSATANDGSVIQPSAGSGRYLLIPGPRVNLLAWGLKLGDSSEGSNNAVRLKNAIVAYKDGGHLLLPASQSKLYLGPYPVRPVSYVTNLNIELHGKIEVPATATWSFTSPGSLFHFADSASYNNLKIFGSASIYGNATNQTTASGSNYGKINCFRIDNTTNLVVDGLTIYGFGNMAVQVKSGDGVRIANLTIDQTLGNNDTYPTRWGANADGVHVYDSRNVIVQNCNIQSTDDCIAFTQATSSVISTNYIVTGNVLRPYAGTVNLVPSGIRIGMESGVTGSRIEDVIVSGNVIKPVGANGMYVGIAAGGASRSLSRIRIAGTIITGAGETTTVQIGPNAGSTITHNSLITGGMYVANASDVTLDGVQIANSRGKAVSVANVGKFIMTKAVVTNILDSVDGTSPRGSAIHLAWGLYANTDEVSITDSTFDGMDGGGIYGDGSSYQVTFMRVVNCRFNNWLRGLYASQGRTYPAILGTRCLTNYIANNRFVNGEGSAIYINSPYSASEHEISNNSFPLTTQSSGSTVGGTEPIFVGMNASATGSRAIIAGNRFGEWHSRAVNLQNLSEAHILGNWFLPLSLSTNASSEAISLAFSSAVTGTATAICANNVVHANSKAGSNPSVFFRTYNNSSSVTLSTISAQNTISPNSGMAHLVDAFAGGARDLAYSANLTIPNSSEIPIRNRVALTGSTTLAWTNPSPGQRGTLDVYPDTVDRTVTLPALAYSPSGSTITITNGTGSTNWTRLAWEVHQVGGTNRIFVSPTAVYR